MKFKTIPVFLLGALVGVSVHAAEPPITAKDIPHFPAVEPKDALGTFRIKKGFHLEVAAAEPLVMDPVAISFDEDGRCYVCEMRDYSERRAEKLGRVRLLEDTDGDGVFDKATVFFEGIGGPTGIVAAEGGVFVVSSPDILFLKDTNGDGVADEKRVVFTGFGNTAERLNIQAIPNSLTWLFTDHRIHGVAAGNGGLVASTAHPQTKAVDLRGKDFSFDTHELLLAAEAGGGQYGLGFDTHAHPFTCSNARHIMTFMYDARYAGRNALYNMPADLIDIPADGPAAEVYRISPDEPYRVIRTRWRAAGLVSGPVEGGGRPSGYFTSASGITIYTGDAFPGDYVNDAFIAEPSGNLVHHKKVIPNGVSLTAVRPADEQKVEFLASTDTWFRPVQFANSPDGCLYVIDMYRECIEHPWSIPESIKKYLDLNNGNDRGRLYRIAPDGYAYRKPPHLSTATTPQLVALLEHSNGWHRETAARLLFQRQDKSAVPLVRELLGKSQNPLGRLHALHALDGLGAITESDLAAALKDQDPFVRQHAVRLCENVLSATPKKGSALAAALARLTTDPDIRVRYQLAFTLGSLKVADRPKLLAEIAQQNPSDPWIQAAVLSSLSEGAGDVFAITSADRKICENPAGRNLLEQLALLIGARNNAGEVARAVHFLSETSDPALAFSLARWLGDGLKRANTSLDHAADGAKSLFEKARKTAADSSAPELARAQAIQLLGLSTFADASATLLPLLEPSEPENIQLAALAALDRFPDAKSGQEIANRLGSYTPRVRSEAVNVLLKRPARISALLKTIESGSFLASNLTTSQVKFIRTHGDSDLRRLAAKVLGPANTKSREEVIASMLPALQVAGDAAKGKQTYIERCSSCHRMGLTASRWGRTCSRPRPRGRKSSSSASSTPTARCSPPSSAIRSTRRTGTRSWGLFPVRRRRRSH